jgi:glycosyltransferase involved in cell wall biosynthesis
VSERIPVLYLAPWVGYGGSDKNTIDWFRWLDRERLAPSLITTQPSPNPLLDQVEPYAEEVWVLPDLMPAEEMPAFIFDFVRSRGVRLVHLMNSRLGFDLLPDLAALPDPPAVVVQMHAEEVDRSGYVRYVGSRYGDLVDCFSLSNEHVAKGLREYGVPAAKTRVIYTGIDADGEFSPDLAEPIEELPDDRLQILFAARLVEQKDPLLMIEVAAALRDEGADFQVHVVGEGDMEGQIEARIEELGLGDHVVLHPPVAGLLNWYAACDVLLLTSTFEGVPVVIFEAMAMGLPIVTPGLPAIREMLDEDDDGVVLPRDSVRGYVEPLARLAADREHLAEWGREMRARAKRLFSVQQMAADHAALYEELLQGRGVPAPLPLPEPPLAVLTESEWSQGGPAGATGPLVALSAGDDAGRLGDADLQEKLLRRFRSAGEELDAIALADAGEEGRFELRALPLDDGPESPLPHAVVWRRGFEAELPQGLRADPAAPVASLVRLLNGAGARLEWRHLRAPGGAAPAAPAPAGEWTAPAGLDAGAAAPSALPAPRGAGSYEVPRWAESPTWIPTRSAVLARFRSATGERKLGLAAEPPPGFELEHVLGALRSEELLGTEPFEGLGYVELAPLPGMDSISRARVRQGGEEVVVANLGDPLHAETDLTGHVGFLDPVPLRPREAPTAVRTTGLVGLVKTVDQAARRHRYALGAVPEGELLAELGGLAESGLQGSVPVWIVDGYLVGEAPGPPRPRRLGRAARWTLEPLRWGGIAPAPDRLKAIARRASVAAGRSTGPASAPGREPDAWLFERDRPGLAPLYAARHPVTGDQLLCHDPETAANLGYADPVRLGYVRRLAVVTGELEERLLPIPWARRFGHVPRPG